MTHDGMARRHGPRRRRINRTEAAHAGYGHRGASWVAAAPLPRGEHMAPRPVILLL